MNNFVYLYDGTFNNLLNLIYYLIINKIKPNQIINERKYCISLFDNVVKPNINCVFEIYLIGKENFRLCNYVFRTSYEYKEILIYYFILNAFKYKDKTKYMRNLICVNRTLKLANYVSRENHKMKGFLRFTETKKGFLYAEVEPENNILDLIAFHFKKRLSNENWVILDKKRNRLCFYNKKDLFIVKKSDIASIKIEISKNETEIENLWRCFFNTIGIKERENKRCQMNFMPKKYWKNILEMRNE